MMHLASEAEVKNQVSRFLSRAKQTVEEEEEKLGWPRLAEDRLREVWKGEDDALYDYLDE